VLILANDELQLFSLQGWENIVSLFNRQYVEDLIQRITDHPGIPAAQLFEVLSQLNLGPVFAGETEELRSLSGTDRRLPPNFARVPLKS
jgi:hypothetical protein